MTELETKMYNALKWLNPNHRIDRATAYFVEDAIKAYEKVRANDVPTHGADARPVAIYQVEDERGLLVDSDWMTYESTGESARRIVYSFERCGVAPMPQRPMLAASPAASVLTDEQILAEFAKVNIHVYGLNGEQRLLGNACIIAVRSILSSYYGVKDD